MRVPSVQGTCHTTFQQCSSVKTAQLHITHCEIIALQAREGYIMLQKGYTAVALLVLLQLCGALAGLADAAAGTAVRSAASAHRSSKSSTEAGQFLGMRLSLGNQVAFDQSSSTEKAATATFVPGLLGSIPGAIASVAGSVLGLQPVQNGPQQPEPAPAQNAPAAKQQQQQPASPKQQPPQQKPKPPQKPVTQKQPQQPQPKQPAAKPATAPKQQQKQQPSKPIAPTLQPPAISGSSLIADGPLTPEELKKQQLQQQQKQHKVYYKRKPIKQPKTKLPVVASVPSYVPQVPVGTVPMCEWRADFNECHVHRHYYLAVEEKPESYIAQTIAAASARDYACSAHTQPSACQESSQGLRCGWNLSGGRTWDSSGCRSYYMAEWTVFSFLIRAGLGAAQAATGLTNLGAFSCPGSLSARALSCNTAFPMDHSGNYDPNLCAAAAPGCIFQQPSNNCVMSPQLIAQLARLNPEDVGTCSAACYLRVLDSCPAKPNRDPGSLTNPDSCWASPGCTWTSGVCRPDLYSSQLDKWGRKVTAAAEACHREKEAWGCGQAAAKRLLPLPSAAVQEALQESLPGPGQDNARCPL